MSKFRILQNQTSSDAFIYCADDPVTNEYLPSYHIKARTYPFSIQKRVEEGAWLEEDKLHILTNHKLFTMLIHDLALQGKHNVYNSMAAGISARVFDIRKETIRESLSDFQNAEHRLEYVSTIHGIEFVNDSKATNVDSVVYALGSYDKPVIWIAGGVDKGNDYNVIKKEVEKKVKTLICLGRDNTKLKKFFDNVIPSILETQDTKELVRLALQSAKLGDVVLLSPACASFDLFKNYEDRGNQFREAVMLLKKDIEKVNG